MSRPSFDVVTLGRVGLDLYARERDTDFAEVSGFDKHVGGSPGLIAIGAAKLGARAAILSRVSDDVVGRYVRARLERFGVDTRGIVLDASGTRTSLAITERRAEGCAVVIYRNGAADLALAPDDIDPALAADTRYLLVSGTALSAEPSRGAARRAIALAREAGAELVFELDYRPYTWASVAEAGAVCREIAAEAAIVIGNREEFAVLGVPEDAEARAVADSVLGGATTRVFVKDGAAGSTVFTAAGETFRQDVFAVDVVKPFGAGDAYAAAILAGLAEERALADCLARGAAAAAIVVAAGDCDEAMPTSERLDEFLAARAAATEDATGAIARDDGDGAPRGGSDGASLGDGGGPSRDESDGPPRGGRDDAPRGAATADADRTDGAVDGGAGAAGGAR